MKTSFWMLGLVSVLSAFGTVACSATADDASDPNTATGDSEDELKTRICGGFAGLTCPTGYRCEITATHPDATGKCKKVKRCGGIAGLTCPTGFDCQLDGNYPDAMGDCVKSVQPAPNVEDFQDCQKDADCKAVNNVEKCCGDCTFEAVNKNQASAYASANWCPNKPGVCPLACRLDTRVAQCNIGKHKCEMVEIADIACGGFTMNPHACPTGYSCQFKKHVADVPGKCVAN